MGQLVRALNVEQPIRALTVCPKSVLLTRDVLSTSSETKGIYARQRLQRFDPLVL